MFVDEREKVYGVVKTEWICPECDHEHLEDGDLQFEEVTCHCCELQFDMR